MTQQNLTGENVEFHQPGKEAEKPPLQPTSTKGMDCLVCNYRFEKPSCDLPCPKCGTPVDCTD